MEAYASSRWGNVGAQEATIRWRIGVISTLTKVAVWAGITRTHNDHGSLGLPPLHFGSHIIDTPTSRRIYGECRLQIDFAVMAARREWHYPTDSSASHYCGCSGECMRRVTGVDKKKAQIELEATQEMAKDWFLAQANRNSTHHPQARQRQHAVRLDEL